MSRLVALLLLCVLATACAASSDFVVTGEAPTSAPPTPVETQEPTPSPEPGTRPDDRADPTAGVGTDEELLLTSTDVPGWNHVGPSDYPAEPTFEWAACSLMNDAWGAHELPGRRVRGDAADLSFRNSVVEMPDEAAAGVVIDAAMAAWQECDGVEALGGKWWIEPVQMPDPGEWRSTALALGTPDESIWLIGWWQRGATIVFIDIEGPRPWDAADALFTSIAGRLNGSPVPATIPSLIQAPTPGATATPFPTPEPRPTPTPRTDWLEDPLAASVPPAPWPGPEWQPRYGDLIDAEAGGEPYDEDCDVVTPSTPAGIEVWFDAGEETELQLVIVDGPPEQATGLIRSFRELAACDLSDAGIETFEIVEFDPAGAGAALRVDTGASFGSAQMRGTFSFAAYDNLLVAIFWQSVSEDGEPPAQMPSTALLEEWHEAVGARLPA